MLLEASVSPNGNVSGVGNDLQLRDGRPLYMVKIVGAVRSFDNRSTNYVIDLEDGTGLMVVKVWVNDSDDCSGVIQMREAACKDHTYIRIIGQVRDFDGQRQVVANDVRPVSSPNEIAYHFLEVAYSYEKHRKRDQATGGNIRTGGGLVYGIGNMASNPPPQRGGVTVTAQGGLGGGSALNENVIDCIKTLGGEYCLELGSATHFSASLISRSCSLLYPDYPLANSDSGVHIVNIIETVVKKGYTENDIRNAVTFLSNEGHIYSTIDENHFQYAE